MFHFHSSSLVVEELAPPKLFATAGFRFHCGTRAYREVVEQCRAAVLILLRTIPNDSNLVEPGIVERKNIQRGRFYELVVICAAAEVGRIKSTLRIRFPAPFLLSVS